MPGSFEHRYSSLEMRKLRVIIVGGGIGGCTLSLSLRQVTPASLGPYLNRFSLTRAGQPDAACRARVPPVSAVTSSDSIFSTTVFEQAPRIEAVGAGISLAPNGLRVMEALGLYGSLKVCFSSGGCIASNVAAVVHTSVTALLCNHECRCLAH